MPIRSGERPTGTAAKEATDGVAVGVPYCPCRFRCRAPGPRAAPLSLCYLDSVVPSVRRKQYGDLAVVITKPSQTLLSRRDPFNRSQLNRFGSAPARPVG